MNLTDSGAGNPTWIPSDEPHALLMAVSPAPSLSPHFDLTLVDGLSQGFQPHSFGGSSAAIASRFIAKSTFSLRIVLAPLWNFHPFCFLFLFLRQDLKAQACLKSNVLQQLTLNF